MAKTRWGAAAALGLVAAVAQAAGADMKKRLDAPQPVFLAGPAIAPAEPLERWIATELQRDPRAVLKLPFAIEPAAPRKAWLGVEPKGAPVALDDSALGISLADRVRHACPGTPGRCVLWLSVRRGPLLGAPEPGAPPAYAVLAVHDAVAAGTEAGALRAQVARAPECLAIRLLAHAHCARGPKQCERCREATALPASPALLDVCPAGDAARPTIAVERDGQPGHRVYDVVRRFADAREAQDFAAAHGITDVQLERRSP